MPLCMYCETCTWYHYVLAQYYFALKICIDHRVSMVKMSLISTGKVLLRHWTPHGERLCLPNCRLLGRHSRLPRGRRTRLDYLQRRKGRRHPFFSRLHNTRYSHPKPSYPLLRIFYCTEFFVQWGFFANSLE